jgi:hypothetical protein
MSDDHGNVGFLVDPDDLTSGVEDLGEATAALREGHLGEAVVATERARSTLHAAIRKVLHDAYPEPDEKPDWIVGEGVALTSTSLASVSQITRLHKIAIKLDLATDQALDWMEWLADQLQPSTQVELDEARRKILREMGITKNRPAWHERASLQSLTQYALMIKESSTVKEVAARLGLNDDQVRQKIAKFELYSISVEGEARVPNFQFYSRGAIPGLDQILPLIPHDWHPLQVLGFLTTETPKLAIEGDAVSPTVWLQSGRDPEVVVAMASKLGHHRE